MWGSAMFSKKMHLFILFIAIILCVSSQKLSNHDETKRTFQSHTFRSTTRNETQTLDDTTHLPLLFLDKNRGNRHTRGIVLIDEDFDKLPDVGVRQSWSGGNSETENTNVIKETEKEWFTDEGSGSNIFNQSSTVEFVTTPDKLYRTKEETQPTTSIDETTEGSGEGVFTSVPTLPEKEQTLNISDVSILGSCFNYTCDDKELIILPGFVETVPEDTNLTFLCSMTNHTSGDLRWYRRNASDNFLLETSNNDNQLYLALQKTKAHDSGKYLCVKLSGESCCHRQLDVTVYKKPNYKYHLLIVGLVAAVSLFTCLLLGIHRRYKLKQYKKELKTQIPLNEFLL